MKVQFYATVPNNDGNLDNLDNASAQVIIDAHVVEQLTKIGQLFGGGTIISWPNVGQKNGFWVSDDGVVYRDYVPVIETMTTADDILVVVEKWASEFLADTLELSVLVVVAGQEYFFNA